jgi:hypothetical protein
MTKVYVVMGNDFPDAVFDNEVDAIIHINICKAQCPRRHMAPRIYWRVYDFPLRSLAHD